MAASWPAASWDPAMEATESAYGAVVTARATPASHDSGIGPARRRCVEALGVTDKRTLARGLRLLKRRLKAP